MPPALSRRDLLKLAVAGGGWLILRPDGTVTLASDLSLPPSPRTTPFLDELPLPPVAVEVEPFFDVPEEYTRLWIDPNTTAFFKICAEERSVKLHSELPPTTIWGYRDLSPGAGPTVGAGSGLPLPDHILGPTLVQLFGEAAGRSFIYSCPPDPHARPIGGGVLIRHVNHLPKDHTGFGVPRSTVHLHGGHNLARADGFPDNLEKLPVIPDGWPCFIASEPPGFKPPRNEPTCDSPHPPVNEVLPDGRVITERQVEDYYYPVLDPGTLDRIRCVFTPPQPIDTFDRPSTQWYHDHLLDFTGPNAYRGQAGFVLCVDELDSHDENDPNPAALHLPSAPYDIPLALQDKRIAPDGSLVFSSFDHDGFLGDKFFVNGKVQPYLEVQRRKYRFRFLNASNARIYRLFINDGVPFGQTYKMDLIATEGGLLSYPLRDTISLLLAMAERLEVVFDFAQFPIGKEVFLENRLPQTNGRKPDDGLLVQGNPVNQLLKFIVTSDPPAGYAGSRVASSPPNVLRPFAKIEDGEIAHAYRRRFKFERTDGAWAINGRFAGDLERPIATPVCGQPEIWTLENSSGGWWHPIHIHSEFFRVLKRNGRVPTITARNPVVAERDGVARRDTILLKGGDTVEVFLRFRDNLGPFVFHCHNMEHEDMAMMARFDVIP
jgi:FtsP/CotA-like multicopper oxidase with cupredoxin domain